MEKEREDFATLLNGYKIRLQIAELDILKKPDMITALTFTVTCLQKPEHVLKAENKTLILVTADLPNKSKQAPHGSLPARRKKIVLSVPINLLGLAVQVDINVTTRVEREIGELNISQTISLDGRLVLQM